MQNVAQARPARRMRHPLVLGGKLQTAVITTDGIEQSEIGYDEFLRAYLWTDPDAAFASATGYRLPPSPG